MKKFLALLMVLFIAFSFVNCGGGGGRQFHVTSRVAYCIAGKSYRDSSRYKSCVFAL